MDNWTIKNSYANSQDAGMTHKSRFIKSVYHPLLCFLCRAQCDAKEEVEWKEEINEYISHFSFCQLINRDFFLENTQITLSAQSIFLSLFRSMLVAEV